MTSDSSPSARVAAYYFPQYHPDPRNDELKGHGWTEWEVVAAARPHFPGHDQPRVPLWGPEDEAQPEVALRKARLARAHGIDAFIVDWYWYEGGPFLERALVEGILPAAKATGLQVALMWANHPWTELYPAPLGAQQTLLSAPNSRYAFEHATNYIIENFFGHSQYLKVEGRAYFSIYDTPSLVEGLGGLAPTRRLLDGFRERARDAGIEVHLNLMSSPSLAGPREVYDVLQPDSTSHYCWWHHNDNGMDAFPTSGYRQAHHKAVEQWRRAPAVYGVPYFPNVSVGWDPSPRTTHWAHDRDQGYPYTVILAEEGPGALADAVADALCFAEEGHGPALVGVNSWNEWTEGSYLEPDVSTGTARIEGIGAAVASHRATRRPGMTNGKDESTVLRAPAASSALVVAASDPSHDAQD
jgi:hypothetical protein